MAEALLLLSILLHTLFIHSHSAKPNILFILVDDLGWANVQYHNDNGEVRTPNIDYLVKNGLELNRHYVHYVCSPTRSSIQSGRLPVHVHLKNYGASHLEYVYEHAGVPPNMTCIAERMQHDAGYKTYFVGKWDAGATVMEQVPCSPTSAFSFPTHHRVNWLIP